MNRISCFARLASRYPRSLSIRDLPSATATPLYRLSRMSMQAYPDSGIYAQMMPICKILLDAKARSGMTFEQLGKQIGRSEVYVAALLYGQAKPASEDIKALSKSLDIPEKQLSDALGENFYPQRGLGPMPPTDPLIYRLYEIVLVYGQCIKAVVNEKFDDGIMSAINFSCFVEKKKTPEGERVVITLDGKWLPHTRF